MRATRCSVNSSTPPSRLVASTLGLLKHHVHAIGARRSAWYQNRAFVLRERALRWRSLVVKRIAYQAHRSRSLLLVQWWGDEHVVSSMTRRECRPDLLALSGSFRVMGLQGGSGTVVIVYASRYEVTTLAAPRPVPRGIAYNSLYCVDR
jgi:hypothetical protein